MIEEIKLQEFDNLKLKLNEYQKSEIENNKKLCEEINKFYPCSLIFQVYKEEDKIYYKRSKIQLDHDFLKLSINYSHYKKKYSIGADFLCFSKLGNYRINEAYKLFDKPNNIGVASTKKIKDWIAYYENVYKALEVENKNSTEKINLFLKGLEGLPVEWSKNNKNGKLLKNGIEFSFRIENGHIFQKIELHYSVGATIEVFKQLSDNKYKQTK